MNFYKELEHEWEKEEHNFDGFCRTVLRNEARDCYRKIASQARKEIMFSEMTQKEMDSLFVEDCYSSDYAVFSVQGYDIRVKGELIIDAIRSLIKIRQDIVLLAFFWDMSDKEIAKCFNMPK